MPPMATAQGSTNERLSDVRSWENLQRPAVKNCTGSGCKQEAQVITECRHSHAVLYSASEASSAAGPPLI